MWTSSAGDSRGWHGREWERWSEGFHFPFFLRCVLATCDFRVWMQADGSEVLADRPIEDKVWENNAFSFISVFWCLLFGSSFLEGDFANDWRGVCGVCWGLPAPVGGQSALNVFLSSWKPGWAVHVTKINQVYLDGADWPYDWPAEAAVFCFDDSCNSLQ